MPDIEPCPANVTNMDSSALDALKAVEDQMGLFCPEDETVWSDRSFDASMIHEQFVWDVEDAVQIRDELFERFGVRVTGGAPRYMYGGRYVIW